MATSERSIRKPSSDAPISPQLTEEIERTLEMVRRVKTAQEAQTVSEPSEYSGNKYVLPEPLVFRVSGSS